MKTLAEIVNEWSKRNRKLIRMMKNTKRRLMMKESDILRKLLTK